MAKQKSIGLMIFGLCSMISAKLALFEPEKHILTPAEERWGPTQKEDRSLDILKGLRYYIWGIGGIGLLIAAEDFISEKRKKERPIKSLQGPQESTSFSSTDSKVRRP
jgi:hypothetical protein